MPWPLTALFVTGAMLLTAISATLSFLFCRSLGTGPVEGLAYGTAAATIDVLKVLAPFALEQAWRNRQLGRGIAAILVWTVAVVVSLSSAIGLAAQARLGKSGAHESMQAQFNATLQQLGEQGRRLASLGAARPAREIEARLQAILAKPFVAPKKRVRTLAAASDNCEKPDRLTAEDCAEVGRLKEELARAGARELLEKQMERLRDKLDSLRGNGAGEGGEADRQAGVIMRVILAVTGIATTLPGVQTALIALIAVALEVGSSCGLYAALGSHSRLLSPIKESRSGITTAQPAGTAGTVTDYCAARIAAQAGARLSMSQAHRDYAAWCEANVLVAVTRGDFMRELRREGQERDWSIAGGVIHHVAIAGSDSEGARDL